MKLRPRHLRTLLASQIVFRLLAATDGHAKNFSIRLQAEGTYMTPGLSPDFHR